MKTLKHNNEQNIGELKIGSRILLVDGVSVSFDGFKALNNLSFSIDYGELRCIIGANGAGKSTMMDVVKQNQMRGMWFLEKLLIYYQWMSQVLLKLE